MTQTDLIYSAADELRLRLEGELYEPGSEGYADACTLFNSMIDKRPRYVARCTTADDVVAALAFARESGLEVAVRAGGHSVAGMCLNDGGIVLDIRGIADIDVDPDARIARVGGGVTWGQLDRATQEHGLATTGGRVSTTGVGGLTLGGGSGWLERLHGLACDNLVGAELVTADGRIVQVSEDEHPDLMWALRGGGGNFGVVTRLDLRLHPVGPDVFAGMLLFPADRGREVVRTLRDVMEGAPDPLSIGVFFTTGPQDDEDVPADLRGEHILIVCGMYAGEPAVGEELIAPLRALGPAADFFEVTRYADFQCSLDDPPGYRNWWTTEHLRELPDEAIDALVEHAKGMPKGPAQLCLLAWGGAVARPRPGSSPLSARAATWVVHPLMLWEDPADDEKVIAHGRSYRDLVAPWATGEAYLNFIGDEGHARVRAGFAPGDYERLQRIKAQWDPENVFRGNQNIAPAS
jgi:FAD/FMN-containing dehydrogenase